MRSSDSSFKNILFFDKLEVLVGISWLSYKSEAINKSRLFYTSWIFFEANNHWGIFRYCGMFHTLDYCYVSLKNLRAYLQLKNIYFINMFSVSLCEDVEHVSRDSSPNWAGAIFLGRQRSSLSHQIYRRCRTIWSQKSSISCIIWSEMFSSHLIFTSFFLKAEWQ